MARIQLVRSTIYKIAIASVIGFLAPFLLLLLAALPFAEFEQNAGWIPIFEHALPPAMGCAFVFGCAAIASFVPGNGLRFFHCLIPLAATLIATIATFTPIQHYKIESPPPVSFAAPVPFFAFAAVFITLFVAGTQRRDRIGAN